MQVRILGNMTMRIQILLYDPKIDATKILLLLNYFSPPRPCFFNTLFVQYYSAICRPSTCFPIQVFVLETLVTIIYMQANNKQKNSSFLTLSSPPPGRTNSDKFPNI